MRFSTNYFEGAPTDYAGIMALPVATDADLSPVNTWAAWETNGDGWEPRHSRSGWVRAKVSLMAPASASPEASAPSAYACAASRGRR